MIEPFVIFVVQNMGRLKAAPMYAYNGLQIFEQIGRMRAAATAAGFAAVRPPARSGVQAREMRARDSHVGV